MTDWSFFHQQLRCKIEANYPYIFDATNFLAIDEACDEFGFLEDTECYLPIRSDNSLRVRHCYSSNGRWALFYCGIMSVGFRDIQDGVLFKLKFS